MDKTVLTSEGNEHRSFNWIMTNRKFYNLNGEQYKVSQDYMGFFPLEDYKFFVHDLREENEEQIDSMAEALDMVYFTDTYGIYELEWKQQDEVLDHSRLLYGGSDYNDVELMSKVFDKDKLVITEFNTIATPTPYGVRRAFEKKFKMNWTGWTGRYFISLDTVKNPEIPRWVIDNYKTQYDTTWHFKNSGLVFVHVTDSIVITETGPDVLEVLPIITTPKKYQERYGMDEFLRYPFWFDIIYLPEESPLEVISYYKLYTTPRGDSILDHHGIPTTFPAAVYQPGKNHRFYYFAGDFADNPISFTGVNFKGVQYLSMFLYDNKDWMDRRKFFWNYYEPMITTILSEYYEEKKAAVQLYVQRRNMQKVE